MVKIAFDAIKLLPLFGVYIWLSLWENNNKSRMFGLVFFFKAVYCSTRSHSLEKENIKRKRPLIFSRWISNLNFPINLIVYFSILDVSIHVIHLFLVNLWRENLDSITKILKFTLFACPGYFFSELYGSKLGSNNKNATVWEKRV